jgi:hypothetical protein
MWDSLLILFQWPNCLVFVYFVVFAAALGRWILQPINVKGGRLRAPTQYLLTDFVWLVLQLQLAFGFCVSWIGIEQPRLFPFVLGFLVLAVTLLWWFGIGCMSRAGVMQPARRAMCTLLVLPGTLGVMISLPALIVLLGVLETDLTTWGDLSVPLREYSRYKVLLWIVTPLLPVIGWMIRQVAFWIVREVHVEHPAEVPVAHGEH